jgi:hypothetical protein
MSKLNIDKSLIIIVILYIIFLTIGFNILQYDNKNKQSDLDYCINAYNDLSLKYYHPQSQPQSEPAEYTCLNITIKDDYYYCNINDFVKNNKTGGQNYKI